MARNKHNHRMLIFFFKGILLGLRQLLTNESPLKIIKNTFHFTIKALRFKISKFLSKLNINLTKQYHMDIKKKTTITLNYVIQHCKLLKFPCLDTCKAPGLDGISSTFLKDDTEVLALHCNAFTM